MADIIDAVGGVEVQLVQEELDVYGYEDGKAVNYGFNGTVDDICYSKGISSAEYHIKKAGVYHLNGIQATAYARIRHAKNFEGTNDDYGRTDRQRYVMEQLFNKALTMDKGKYMSLAKALMPCSETSLSYSEIISLAFNILLSSPTFEQSRIPLTEYQMPSKSISGVGSCIYYDLDYAKKIIHAFFYDDIKPEDYIEANGVEKNDWYANRNSSQTASKKPSSSSSSSQTTSSKPESSVTSEPSRPAESSSSASNVSSSEPVQSNASSESENSTGNQSSEAESSGESKPESEDTPTASEDNDGPPMD